MKNILTTGIGLALLRIAPSLMILTHGIPKLQRLLGGGEIEFADPIGLGATPTLFLTIIGEVVCPVLLILGLKTRWAATPPAIVVIVAAFVVNAGSPFQDKELSLLYLVFFLTILLLGPGKYSIDKK